MLWPANSMSPAEARSMPEITLTRVDFPAPFAPTTETISPSSTSNETPSSTRACPYCAEIELTLSKLVSQIGLDHARISCRGLWRAFENLFAVMQHDECVGQCHHR